MTRLQAQAAKLVVGAGGLIGKALAERLAGEGWPVLCTTRTPRPGAIALDLAKDVSSWTPPRRVDVAYLCAAVVSLHQCRTDPVGSYAVNVTGTVNLARTLLHHGAHVVFTSSNLVFDGSLARPRSDTPVSPATEYGRQKVETERQLLALSDRVCVVRLTKVFGPNTPLLTRWAEDLRRGQTIHPFVDLPVAPVALDFAVDVLLEVGRRRLGGIVQVSATEEITYEAVARRIADQLGVSQELVVPIRAADSRLDLEHVPQHAALDVTRLRNEIGMTPPDVWSTIDGAFA